MPDSPQNRRNFLQLLATGTLGLSLASPFRAVASNRQQARAYLLYTGTYTSGKSEGIYIHQLNPETGKLTPVSVAKSINPSFLAFDPQRKYLFAVNEIKDFEGQNTGAVSAFSVNQQTGALTFLNQQSSQGASPCYIITDQTGKFALIANYTGGNVAVLPIQPDGKLGAVTQSMQHEGSSVNANRQKEPHAHCIVLDSSGKYAFAADLGIDKVQVYQFNQGKLSAAQPPFVPTKPGAGPRHFTFHPNGNYAYVINELNATLTAYSYEKKTGNLRELQTVPMLPEDFSGESSCADVHITPDGKFIYGSNRGHDSIAGFTIDRRTGKLTYIAHTPTQGKTPRNFTIDPTGKLLLVANQQSDNVVSFRIDSRTGKLTPTGIVTEIPNPVCLQIIPAFG